MIWSHLFSQIREKTAPSHPWRQATRPRISPDAEVSNIMAPPVGGARPRTPSGRGRERLMSPGKEGNGCKNMAWFIVKLLSDVSWGPFN